MLAQVLALFLLAATQRIHAAGSLQFPFEAARVGLLLLVSGYLVWLAAQDARRLIIPMLLFGALASLTFFTNCGMRALASLTAVICALGVMALLFSVNKAGVQWLSTRMFWVALGILTFGVLLVTESTAARNELLYAAQELGRQIAPTARIEKAAADVPQSVIPYVRYSPLIALLGLLLAIFVASARGISTKGIGVRKDYLPNARLLVPQFESHWESRTPLLLLPVLTAAQIARRAVATFYNTLVNVVNGIIRAAVFTWRVSYLFMHALAIEFAKTAQMGFEYSCSCARKAVLPLLGIYLALVAVVVSHGIAEAHLGRGSLATGFYLIALLGLVALAVGLIFVGVARVPGVAATEIFVRDLTVALAYAIPAFGFAALLIILTDKYVSPMLGWPRYYHFGPLSLSTYLLLLLALVWFGGRQVLARIRARDEWRETVDTFRKN